MMRLATIAEKRPGTRTSGSPAAIFVARLILMMIHTPTANHQPRVRHVRWLLGAIALLATLFAGCTADAGNTARLASNQTLIYANTGGGPLVEPYFDPTDSTKDIGGLNLDPAF